MHTVQDAFSGTTALRQKSYIRDSFGIYSSDGFSVLIAITAPLAQTQISH